jgi:hypothetical protein
MARTWPMAVRVWLLALNFLPLLHLALVAWVVWRLPGWGWKAAGGLTSIYLAPALAARAVLTICPVKGGSYAPGSRAFLIWWASAQLQMIFCRLPALEEVLRLAPGLYSLWLRLWGARIGRLTFWAPRLRILDRSFLRVGDDVVFGTGVCLNAHVLDHHPGTGQAVLHLADIVVGDRAQIGGYSLLTAGTEVGSDECLRALTVSPPFSRWTNGRRSRHLIATSSTQPTIQS